MLHRLETNSKVVGMKQTIKALQKNIATVVYVAEDADKRVVRQAIEIAKDQGLPVITVETMVQLGKECKIEVKTAIAATIH
ncbi:MAG TPA: 50S ribosomal protein L7ae-like protein [Epulopiscium sp.]|nr:50S ribosomal protein L7ae-like protein [Candidatus Epulonipiscium sp.]